MKRLRPPASRALGRLLRTAAGDSVERLLVALCHLFPHRLRGRGVIAEQLAERHRGADLVARLRDGSRLSVPSTREGLTTYLHGRAYDEDEGLTRLLLSLLRDDHVFFDVGASLGYYTILAARRCRHVHAFEPRRALARHLRKSVELNRYDDRVRITEAAVANRDGTSELYLPADDATHLGVASLLPHEWLGATRESVAVISLDAYVREHDVERVDVIKVDVEGAEMLVLEGMRGLLERRVPAVLLLELWSPTLTFDTIATSAELHPAPSTSNVRAMHRFLREHGYEARTITRRGRIGNAFADDDRVPRSINVAFVRR